MTAAGVSLLEAEELQLGLDSVHETLAHDCGWVDGDGDETIDEIPLLSKDPTVNADRSSRVVSGRLSVFVSVEVEEMGKFEQGCFYFLV